MDAANDPGLPPMTGNAMSTTAMNGEAQLLVVENETVNMSGDGDRSHDTEPDSDEFILVPSDTAKSVEAGDTGDEITIHIEGPGESLTSSTLTARSSILLAPSSSAREDDDDGSEADAEDASPRQSRVRFRSRVRITSGLHHHRHRHRVSTSASASTSVSSLSSSPSSSVSAPLRSPPTEDTCTPGWGTLGSRVGLFALAKQQQQLQQQGRGRRRAETERSALLGGGMRQRYGDDNEDDDQEGSEFDDSEALLSRQIDLVFGRWPWRLLNRHWWWWQLQPIVCCGCLDESDAEE